MERKKEGRGIRYREKEKDKETEMVEHLDWMS